MGIRVLQTVDVPATSKRDIWLDDSRGYPIIFSDTKGIIAAEDQDELAFVARCIIDAMPLTGKSVAWIGGGTCLGPRLFLIAPCTQAVYELEPSLAEFCPGGVTFIAGDYKLTLTGKYDVIVYDLGGEVPTNFLARHLNPGGKILP